MWCCNVVLVVVAVQTNDKPKHDGRANGPVVAVVSPVWRFTGGVGEILLYHGRDLGVCCDWCAGMGAGLIGLAAVD